MIHPELERWIFAMPFGLGPLQELAYTGSIDVEASVTNPRNLGWFAAAKVSSLGIQMSFFGMAYAETSTVLYAGAIRSAFFGSTGLFTAFGVSSATVATAVSTAGVVGFVGYGVVRAAQSSTTRSEAYARRNRRYYAAQRETTRVTRTGQRHEGGRRSE